MGNSTSIDVAAVEPFKKRQRGEDVKTSSTMLMKLVYIESSSLITQSPVNVSQAHVSSLKAWKKCAPVYQFLKIYRYVNSCVFE